MRLQVLTGASITTMLRCVVSCKLTDVSEMLTATIIRAVFMMEAVSISKTSVNVYETTPRNILEDSLR
jgi:hypothetical protein